MMIALVLSSSDVEPHRRPSAGNRSRRGTAFTLIELLASMSLMMVLSLTVLMVLGAIGRSEAVAAHANLADAWPSALVDLVRWDLANSRSLHVADDTFTLGGYAALSPDGGAVSHTPVLVTYSIKMCGAHSCLVRTQLPAQANSSALRWTELIESDVAKMSLVKLEMPARRAATSAPTNAAPSNVAFAMPARVSLTLWSADQRIAPLSAILLVRD